MAQPPEKEQKQKEPEVGPWERFTAVSGDLLLVDEAKPAAGQPAGNGNGNGRGPGAERPPVPT
jgi:hypothetical protein